MDVNCPYCREGIENPKLIVFEIPELVRNKVKILDMNLLCHPEALEIIKELGRRKINGKVIIEKIFTGNDFPPKVRYDVDIRKIIPKIIEIIQYGLSEKNYIKNYGDYDLTKIFINNQI